MIRISFALLVLLIISCSDKKTTEDDTGAFNYENFSDRFKKAALPYHLSDTGLLKNKDTATIHNAVFASFISDSLHTRLFSKGALVKYIPLAQVGEKNKEIYFIIKAVSGSRKIALLVAFDKDQNYGSVFPFLVPDTDPNTMQVSSIDKSYSISRTVSRRGANEVITEGKNVYVYNSAARTFTLIMTDLLDDTNMEIINPIDTFSKKHRYAGDYTKDKKNLVSIRDGASTSEINFFIHFNQNSGECSGELKGTAFFTSSKMAIYRQRGDACVLELHFISSSVTLKEVEGCGAHRGTKCVFEGTFRKKKEIKLKTNSAKTR